MPIFKKCTLQSTFLNIPIFKHFFKSNGIFIPLSLSSKEFNVDLNQKRPMKMLLGILVENMK